MPLSSSNAVRQLSDGNSQGTVLGQSANDAISFYNATPVTKTTTNLATLSSSSGALASSIAIILNGLGLIVCTSVSA